MSYQGGGFAALLEDLDELHQRREREYALQKSEQAARLERQDLSIQRQCRQITAERQRLQEAARRRQRVRRMMKSLRQLERDTRAIEAASALHTQNRVRAMLAELTDDAKAGRLTAVQAGMVDVYRGRAAAMGLRP